MLDLDRLRTLGQLARENAAESERQRRLPDILVAEMARCGLFRYLAPACFGGKQGPLGPLFEALIELGRCCPSAAWVASLFASHSVIAAWFPEAAQRAIWAEGPDARSGTSLAPMGVLSQTS